MLETLPALFPESPDCRADRAALRLQTAIESSIEAYVVWAAVLDLIRALGALDEYSRGQALRVIQSYAAGPQPETITGP